MMHLEARLGKGQRWEEWVWRRQGLLGGVVMTVLVSQQKA